jgi:HNH endonuclease
MFNPGLEIGQEINNVRLCEIFGCSPQGGMRKSNKINTLVIVSDYTRGIYHDKWIGGVLH